MTGVIWFVQVVHYPLMGRVREVQFAAYAVAHQQRTTWVVGPLMILEALTAGALVWMAVSGGGETAWPWVGLGLLALIWLSTFAVQVPLHARLASGFSEAAWRRLVATNWVRTIAWTARSVIALAMMRSVA